MPTFNRYRYVGEQHDDDLGLIYLRARYLNPESGRFWSTDSSEGYGLDPASLHKYVYANGNPVTMMDPSGNFTLAEVAISVDVVSIFAQIATPKIAAAAVGAKNVYGVICLTQSILDRSNAPIAAGTTKDEEEAINNDKAIVAHVAGYINNANKMLSMRKISGKIKPIFYYSSIDEMKAILSANVESDTRYAAALAHGIYGTRHDQNSYMHKVNVGGAEVSATTWAAALDSAAKGRNPRVYTNSINCDSSGEREPYELYTDLLMLIDIDVNTKH